MTAADQTARNELIDLLDKRQTTEFRRLWAIEVPNQGSGLPANYDLVSYDEYWGNLESNFRIAIQVRGDQARLELVDREGIFRASLPQARVDGLARLIAYAFLAQQQLRGAEVAPHRLRFGGHLPDQRVEIISQEKEIPWHLKTPAWQPAGLEVSRYFPSAAQLAHTIVCREVRRLSRMEGKLLPAEAERQEVILRLKQQAKPLNQSPVERASIESLLYAQLAVRRAMVEAISELQRLELKTPLRCLQLATAADPQPLMRAALLSAKEEDLAVAYFALEFACDPRHPERLSWVFAALAEARDPSIGQEWLQTILRNQLGDGQIAALDKLFHESPHLLTQIQAASWLLERTDKDEYFEFLRAQVKVPQPFPEGWQNPRLAAAKGLIDAAFHSGNRREDAYPLLQALHRERFLRRDESFDRWVVTQLSMLGGPADVPFLKKIAAGDSDGLAECAIRSLAQLEPDTVMELVHERMQRFLDDKPSTFHFSGRVANYFDLVIWKQDAAAIPLLKRAQAHLQTLKLNRREEVDDPQLVLEIVAAPSLERRLQATLDFFRLRDGDERMRHDKARQLIAAGAAPESCAELLRTNAERAQRGR